MNIQNPESKVGYQAVIILFVFETWAASLPHSPPDCLARRGHAERKEQERQFPELLLRYYDRPQ